MVKNQFGYVKSKPESGNGNKQQPPISKPVSGASHQVGTPLPTQTIEQTLQPMSSLPTGNTMGSPIMQNMVRGLLDQRGLYNNQMESSSALSASNLLAKRYGATPQNINSGFPSNSQLTSLLSGSSIADLANSSGLNPYEKWSNGSDSLFGGLTGPNNQPDAFKERIGLGHQSSNDSIMDLSSKFMSQTSLSSPPIPPGTPLSSAPLNSALYPPKSQIKRQKMIYHCKFGEFGILEGQFTEPSGVAVNAQNDIIVLMASLTPKLCFTLHHLDLCY